MPIARKEKSNGGIRTRIDNKRAGITGLGKGRPVFAPDGDLLREKSIAARGHEHGHVSAHVINEARGVAGRSPVLTDLLIDLDRLGRGNHCTDRQDRPVNSTIIQDTGDGSVHRVRTGKVERLEAREFADFVVLYAAIFWARLQDRVARTSRINICKNMIVAEDEDRSVFIFDKTPKRARCHVTVCDRYASADRAGSLSGGRC